MQETKPSTLNSLQQHSREYHILDHKLPDDHITGFIHAISDYNAEISNFRFGKTYSRKFFREKKPSKRQKLNKLIILGNDLHSICQQELFVNGRDAHENSCKYFTIQTKKAPTSFLNDTRRHDYLEKNQNNGQIPCRLSTMRARKRLYLLRLDRSLKLFARFSRHLGFFNLLRLLGRVGDLCLLYLCYYH